MSVTDARITVRDLDMRYGERVIQRDLNFTVRAGEIFVIMGGSGCGKSTLLRHLIGLVHPARGGVLYDGESFWTAEPEAREGIMRRFGVLYQSGALWSSLTLAENVSLPLGEYTRLTAAEIAELVSLKLALVGLAGFEEFYPSEISGGLGATVVIVTHELASIFAIAGNCVFLDAETKTMIATGNPRDLLEHSADPKVRRFLTRGESDGGTQHG